jgi:amino acid adenylation domain-containing protein
LQGIYVAPETETEKTLVSIWADLLGYPADEISASANFFELGGHSLLATRLVSEIATRLERDIPVRTIFENNTISLLAACLDDQAEVQHEAIIPANRGVKIPLSFSQQRLLFIDRLGGSLQYNMPMALRLKGNLNHKALQCSLDTIVKRHEVLRSVYVEQQESTIQVVREATPVIIKKTDLKSLDNAHKEVKVQQLAQLEAATAFNLAEDLMLRANLLMLSNEEHVVLVTLHHIACDGWSLGIITKELVTLYEAYSQEQPNPLTPLTIQYGDFAYWQRNTVSDEKLSQQLAYWRRQLEGIPQVHSLPLDKPRPLNQSFEGQTYTQFLDKALLDNLNKLAQSNSATLFMLLQSAFALLLGRWSHETDIVIGSPIAGRTRKEVEPLIGFFINTLVFRNDVTDGKSFTQLLNEARQTTLDAFANQDISFDMLVEALKPARSLSHTPVYQVQFSLQNNEEVALSLPNLSIKGVDSGYNTIKFDLSLSANECENGLTLNWSYAFSLFENGSIQRLAASFETLLQGISAAPDTMIEQFSLVNNQEKQQLIQWEHGVQEVFDTRGIHQLFIDQVLITPEAIAVQSEDGQLSYKQLNEQSDRLACYLMAKDLKRVGIYGPRSPELFIALLGALKAGAAYVPLEPKNSPERLAEIINDAELTLVLTSGDWTEFVPGDIETLLMDDSCQENWMTEYANQPPQSSVNKEDIAYIIYTSGSTGTPKGVEINHIGLSDYCGFALNHYYTDYLAGSFVVTSHGFDITVPSLYLPLLKGDTVTLLEQDNELPRLAEKLHGQSICGQLLRMTPMHVKGLFQLLPESFQSDATHVFVIGGEAFSENDARVLQQIFPASQIYNHYGPTETVVGCTMFDVTTALNKSIGSTLPIGRPMSNTRALVLNSYSKRIPLGFVGELHIGGPCVAKGYMRRPELTAEKFIQDPFNIGEKLYKTGDLVRFCQDGNLEFIGRADHQIKIRGFRVESGEIEARLLQHEAVHETTVLAVGEGQDKQLVAWVILNDDMNISENEAETALVSDLRQFMSHCLPDYMRPSAYVCLAAMPLTASGKLNKRALPVPDLTRHQIYVEPQTDSERKLVSIWEDILQLDNIGITANFFDLGGHSLLATRVVSAIREVFQIEIPLTEIFTSRTVQELAEVVDKQVIKIQNQSAVNDQSDLVEMEW